MKFIEYVCIGIDNDLVSRELITSAGVALGLDIKTSSSPDLILAKINTGPIDLLIISHQLNEMPGLDVFHYLGARMDEIENIILFTSADQSTELERYKNLKIKKILHKPVSAKRLAEVIRQTLGF
jgi:CheY-like chemotaxis protein